MTSITHTHPDTDRLTWGCDACTRRARYARAQAERAEKWDSAKMHEVVVEYEVYVGTLRGKTTLRLPVPDEMTDDEYCDFVDSDDSERDRIGDLVMEAAMDRFQEESYIDRWSFKIGKQVSE